MYQHEMYSGHYAVVVVICWTGCCPNTVDFEVKPFGANSLNLKIMPIKSFKTYIPKYICYFWVVNRKFGFMFSEMSLRSRLLKHLNDLEIRNSQSFFEDVMIFMLIYNIRFEDYCFLEVDFPIQQ